MDKHADNLTPQQIQQREYSRRLLKQIINQEAALMNMDPGLLAEADFALMMGTTENFLEYTKKK